MQIRPMDIHDDAQLRLVYELNRRSEMLGREQAPHWTFEEYAGATRSPDSGEREELFGAFEDDRLVGTSVLWSFLLDNTDKAWSSVQVDPLERGRGLGGQLVADLEARVREDGRAMLMGDTKIPFAEVENHPYRRFLEGRGYALSNIEVVRYLHLPVPESVLQGWIDEEAMTPQRFEERRVMLRAMGCTVFETLALTPDRQTVAQSTMVVSADVGADVHQWGTFVHREHRGRRLGLAVKALNLRTLQQARPDVKRVVTQNGETNDFMVSINETVGFEPVEASAEFVKHLR